MESTAHSASGPLSAYDPDGFYCEMLGGNGDTADHTLSIRDRLNRLNLDDLRGRARDAELELYSFGITFTVYTQKDVIDRILPFDVIPRVISAKAWETIERGVTQRVTALNRFLWDIYHDQKILKDGIIPRDLVLGNKNYCAQMQGVDVPFGTYVHINGTDLVRGDDGQFVVLEDNARCPSGVSYVVENRHLMQRSFPDLMSNIGIRPVSNYGQKLHEALVETAPGGD